MGFTEATKVNVGHKTLSPFSTPKTCKPKWIAEVAEFKANAYFVLVSCFILSSKLDSIGPCGAIQLLLKTVVNKACSLPLKSGGDKYIFSFKYLVFFAKLIKKKMLVIAVFIYSIIKIKNISL